MFVCVTLPCNWWLLKMSWLFLDYCDIQFGWCGCYSLCEGASYRRLKSFQGLWIFSQKLLYLKEFLLLFISMDIKAFTEWICNLSVGGWEKDCGMEAEQSFWPWQECSITHLTVKWYKTFHSAVWLRKCDFFPQVGAVVVGLDQYINYYKLQ